jgi:succinate-semialdehyde dehydrogenase/glutarate-semialdehyde dehydrogenase
MNLSNIINSAHKTFLEWKKVPFTERQTLLLKLADVLEKDKEKFAKLITTEMHKHRFRNPLRKSKKVQE